MKHEPKNTVTEISFAKLSRAPKKATWVKAGAGADARRDPCNNARLIAPERVPAKRENKNKSALLIKTRQHKAIIGPYRRLLLYALLFSPRINLLQ